MSELQGLKVTKPASNLGSMEMWASLRIWPSLSWSPSATSLPFSASSWPPSPTPTSRMLCCRESCLSRTPQVLQLWMMGLQFSFRFWRSKMALCGGQLSLHLYAWSLLKHGWDLWNSWDAYLSVCLTSIKLKGWLAVISHQWIPANGGRDDCCCISFHHGSQRIHIFSSEVQIPSSLPPLRCLLGGLPERCVNGPSQWLKSEPLFSFGLFVRLLKSQGRDSSRMPWAVHSCVRSDPGDLVTD